MRDESEDEGLSDVVTSAPDPLAGITLTDEQQRAVDMAVAAIKERRPLFTIGGLAGTGKTTIMHAIREASPIRLIPCAYTGKAACVLRSKGLDDAGTIHSNIYKPHEVAYVDPKSGKTKYRLEFGLITRDLLDGDGFLVDEGSMISGELFNDMRSFEVPIIVVGDHGQLEPISKMDVNLMRDPNVTLEKIHRQAAESGIIRLAHEIRRGGAAYVDRLQAMDTDDVIISPKHEVRHDTKAEVVLCGFNKTRCSMNEHVRRRRGLEGKLAIGERIICLSNDRQLGVFNGLMGNVVAIEGERVETLYPRGEDEVNATIWQASVHWDGDEKPRPVTLSGVAIGAEKLSPAMPGAHFGRHVIVDYGYCVTVHKAQGSQWDNVAVLNEKAPKIWNQARWAYTAVTRAAKKLRLGHEGA